MRSQSRQRKGYLVPAAMAIIAVLLTLVVALQYRGSVSSNVRQLSAAECQADQAVENSLARVGSSLQDKAIPGTDSVGLKQKFDFSSGQSALQSLDKQQVYLDVEGLHQPWQPLGAENLYSGNSQPQAGAYAKAQISGKLQGNNRTDSPWITLTSMRPKSSNPALGVFGSRRYEAAFHEGFPFAAYAPQGKVELTAARAWSNPTVLEMKTKAGQKSQDQVSGLPCYVAAKTGLKVEDFPHGRAYLPAQATLDVKGGAVALPGLPLPVDTPNAYENLILSDIEAAYNGLRATGIDKTGLIFGRLDLSSFIALFKGAEFPNFFSLESSLSFFFPTIPVFKNKGAWVELMFHVPLPPDQNLENVINGLTGTDGLDDVLTDLNSANQQLILLKQQRDAKITERNKYASNSTEYKNLTSEIDELNTKISDKQKEIEGYQKKLSNASDGAHDAFEQGVADGKIEALRSLPESRQDEKDAKSKGLTASYWTGFSYIGLILDRWTDLGEIVVKLIGAIFDSDGFDVDVLLKLFFKEVRLVHLGAGKPEPLPTKMFQKGLAGDLQAFAIDKTWTVPRGRTFRIQTSLVLKGDLWVQRGACMIVDKDLIMFAKDGTNPFLPKGRIFLEEGATLLVGGNLEGAGDSTYGSLVVGTPVGREHPVQCAVICQGKVDLPFGTRSGISLDDLARGLEEEFNFSGASDVLETVFTDILPNASKILGPFHMRNCYFARWVTTFSIPTVFPVPIPTPIPDNKHKNYLCLVFRALTMVYTAHLNATLGENLMTSTDWWLIGKERVPMVPKLDPYALKNYVEQIVSTVKNLAANLDDVEEALKTLGEDLLTHMIQDVVKKVIVEFIADQVIQGFIDGISPVAGFIYSATLADEVDAQIATAVDNTYGKLADEITGKLNLSENGSVDQLFDYLTTQITSASADTLLPETSGVLVYGKSSIDMGGLLASGWFVSQGNINITSLYTVGSLLSSRGNITAKTLLYNPYFTKASLYLPETLLPGGPGIDDLDDFWANAVNYKYGKTLHKSRGNGPKALSVGRKTCFQSAAGWSPK